MDRETFLKATELNAASDLMQQVVTAVSGNRLLTPEQKKTVLTAVGSVKSDIDEQLLAL